MWGGVLDDGMRRRKLGDEWRWGEDEECSSGSERERKAEQKRRGR